MNVFSQIPDEDVEEAVRLMHSHPQSVGWQGMSGADRETEQSYARVVETITGHPLVGMTLAGAKTWAARSWYRNRGHHDAESVRIVGDHTAGELERHAPTRPSVNVRLSVGVTDPVLAQPGDLGTPPLLKMPPTSAVLVGDAQVAEQDALGGQPHLEPGSTAPVVEFGVS